LVLEIDVGQRLPVVIADDAAGVGLLGGPGRREAAQQPAISPLQAFCGLAEPWPCRGRSPASCSDNSSPCRIVPLSRFPIHPRETSPAPAAARSRCPFYRLRRSWSEFSPALPPQAQVCRGSPGSDL